MVHLISFSNILLVLLHLSCTLMLSEMEISNKAKHRKKKSIAQYNLSHGGTQESDQTEDRGSEEDRRRAEPTSLHIISVKSENEESTLEGVSFFSLLI